jgi:hypothetical protein
VVRRLPGVGGVTPAPLQLTLLDEGIDALLGVAAKLAKIGDPDID